MYYKLQGVFIYLICQILLLANLITCFSNMTIELSHGIAIKTLFFAVLFTGSYSLRNYGRQFKKVLILSAMLFIVNLLFYITNIIFPSIPFLLWLVPCNLINFISVICFFYALQEITKSDNNELLCYYIKMSRYIYIGFYIFILIGIYLNIKIQNFISFSVIICLILFIILCCFFIKTVHDIYRQYNGKDIRQRH